MKHGYSQLYHPFSPTRADFSWRSPWLSRGEARGLHIHADIVLHRRHIPDLARQLPQRSRRPQHHPRRPSLLSPLHHQPYHSHYHPQHRPLRRHVDRKHRRSQRSAKPSDLEPYEASIASEIWTPESVYCTSIRTTQGSSTTVKTATATAWETASASRCGPYSCGDCELYTEYCVRDCVGFVGGVGEEYYECPDGNRYNTLMSPALKGSSISTGEGVGIGMAVFAFAFLVALRRICWVCLSKPALRP